MSGAMVRRHGDVFGRIGGDPCVLIDPVDLPWLFVIRPAQTPPVTVADRHHAPAQVDAVIRAPVGRLIDLLEGRVDGDALFFSRELTIEGDTAAVVALRNAVDSAGIRIIDDALSPLGLLAGPVKGVVRAGLVLLAALAAKIERALDGVAGGEGRAP
jgi:predicted lipid carrier protein YhbT